MEKIKEYIPIISGFLLVLGSIKLIYFYSYFGISIIDYIDLSEIISLSIDFFFSSLFYLLFVLVVVFILISIAKSDDWYLSIAPIGENSKFLRGYLYASVTYIVMFGMFGLFIIGPASRRVGAETFLLLIPMLMLIPPVVPLWHKYLIKYYKLIFDKDLKDISLFLTVGLLVFLFTSMLYSRINARALLYDEYVSMQFVFKDKVVRTDPLYRFIGKNKGYLFFYNKITNSYHALSSDGLVSVTSENKNKGNFIENLIY